MKAAGKTQSFIREILSFCDLTDCEKTRIQEAKLAGQNETQPTSHAEQSVGSQNPKSGGEIGLVGATRTGSPRLDRGREDS